jgi:hypothetical protein
MPEQVEDKKISPPRAAAYEPAPPPPSEKSIIVGGKATGPTAANRPAPSRPGYGGPQSMMPLPSKPEPLMPTQPVLPSRGKRSLLGTRPKTWLAVLIALWIAIIAALLWWLL